jgi:hypothetical protein
VGMTEVKQTGASVLPDEIINNFLLLLLLLESSGYSNFQKPPHPIANTDKIHPRRQAFNIHPMTRSNWMNRGGIQIE